MKLSFITAACAVSLGSSVACAATAKPPDIPAISKVAASMNSLAFGTVAVGVGDFGNFIPFSGSFQTPPLILQTNWVLPANDAAKGTPRGIVTANSSPASLEPDALMMLLTGLGVMGSIARRRHLAKKSA
jgi:hypothetical protein